MNRGEAMSSVVAVSCDQGFVISTDTVAFKLPVGDARKYGRVRASTHKLFQLSDDVLAAGVGEWTNYFPVLNAAARSGGPTDKLVPDLLEQCAKKAANSRVYILYREGKRVKLDTSELGHARRELPGAHSYPDPLLDGLFDRVYESPEGLALRKTGILGICALIDGFNALAASLSPELSSPFDTVCFLTEGLFAVHGGVTRLPITDVW
jgi:hypothetical protein